MTPISYHQNDSHHHPSHSMAASATIREYRDSMGFGTAFFLALLTHVGTVMMFFLVYAILVLFLKIKIPFFEPLQPRTKDIEFVLVDNNKPEPPRNKHTKNRSDKMSRSGGQKIANRPQAVPQRAAGKPTPKPVQRPQPVSKPTPRPQPPAAKPQVTQRPMPKPTPMVLPVPAPTPKPAPPKAAPAPKLPKPTQVTSNAPTLPPSPVTPNIKIPLPVSNPQAVSSGPVVSSSSGPVGGRSGGGGAAGIPGPQAIPGSLSRNTGYGTSGGGSRGGQSGGAGGQGSMNQSGSPGGGGGRPGIDAMPEPDFGPYIAELQRRIKRNWAPPSSDRSKRVVALFTVGRQGQLLGVRLKVGSGSPSADEAALSAVRASAPFRPLPANYRNNTIDIEFIFDYDVYTGGRIR